MRWFVARCVRRPRNPSLASDAEDAAHRALFVRGQPMDIIGEWRMMSDRECGAERRVALLRDSADVLYEYWPDVPRAWYLPNYKAVILLLSAGIEPSEADLIVNKTRSAGHGHYGACDIVSDGRGGRAMSTRSTNLRAASYMSVVCLMIGGCQLIRPWWWDMQEPHASHKTPLRFIAPAPERRGVLYRYDDTTQRSLGVSALRI